MIHQAGETPALWGCVAARILLLADKSQAEKTGVA
jgi:hypothetical protein